MAKKRGIRINWATIIITIVAMMVITRVHYLWQPAWNLRTPETWLFLLVSFTIISLPNIIHDYIAERINAISIAIYGMNGIVLVLTVVLGLYSSTIFNAQTYRNIITVSEGNFEEEFEDVCNGNFITMDMDTAQRLGDRVLGSVPNATWYEIDPEYNLIIYQGEQYRISPLKYGGFFKYMKAKTSGIPGYVLVDCQTNEARFIQTAEPIKYAPSAFFGNNLKRHLRGQFPGEAFDSFFMEIDEEGIPYWVSATTEPQAGVWGGRKVTRFILTNACTGESKMYNIEDKPEWLDHVLSLRYMMKRAEWYYEFVNGFWNFSRTGILRTSFSYTSSEQKKDEPNFYGYNTFVSKEGKVLLFTGITPANRTESNVGFLTVDCASGEFRYYPIPGAEESSAQAVIEGLVQNMGYQATYPIMVNVAGRPTYLMNLKDKSGLIQRYAMVSLENYANAYVGMTFQDTLEGYLREIGNPYGNVDVEKIVRISGLITEKYQAEMDGTTYFYYIVDGELYRASIKINEEQVLFKVGDIVEMEVVQSIDNMYVIQSIKR